MKRIKNSHLYGYYLLIQALHLVMLVIIFLDGFEKYLPYVSSDLLPLQASMLRISGYIDLFLSAPLGIVGSILALRDEKHDNFLTISVTFLWVSAIVYETALLLNYPARLLSVNLLFHLLFLPVVLLSYRLVRKRYLER